MARDKASVFDDLLREEREFPPSAAFRERAVVREVLEEAGIEVGAVGYLGSQPWPFPASLMLGFTARAVDAREPRPDGVELAQARWFDRETLLAELLDGRLTLPPPLSIARRLIEHWYGAELPDGPESWT